MSEFLERLKEGLAQAQERHADNTKRYQAATAVFQGSNAEVQGYLKVIELETRRELEQAASAPRIEGPPTRDKQEADRDVNKTQVVKDALSEHPGLTPIQVWGAVKGQINNRNYVYSILKRLKDKKLVTARKGKYYLPEVPKIVEGNQEPTTVQ